MVREAANLEIELATSVTDEIDLHDRLTKDALGTARELQQAHAALQSAPVSEVDAALKALTDASLRSMAASALTDTLSGVALSRLRNVVYDQLAGWEAQAVELFNTAVDRHGLSEVAPDLPDLTCSPRSAAIRAFAVGLPKYVTLPVRSMPRRSSRWGR